MNIYGHFKAWFGPKLAGVLTAFCYAVIIIMIIFLLPIEGANFRYGSY